MNKLTVTLALLALPAMTFAGTQYGRVVDIKGSGFISYEGKTHEIKKGEVIYTDSEIIIEHSGQVSFTDNADHRFHLGNASSAAVYAGKVELRSGDMWVQSINKTDDSSMVTANAAVNFTGGEAILSYDSMKGKTQLMVINGLMKFSNLRAPELNLTVAEGNFSFVDQKFEEGMPRDPTPVGQKTYGELVAIFTGVSPMDAHSAEIFKGNDKMEKVTRGIASVTAGHGEAPAHKDAHKEEKHELKKEEHKVVAHEEKAAEHKEVKEEVKAVAQAPKKKTTPVANNLVVKIWGQTGSEASATTDIYDIPSVVKTESTQGSSRMPASVPETETHTATVLDQVVPNDSVKTNPTAPQYKESDKLIEQLNKL